MDDEHPPESTEPESADSPLIEPETPASRSLYRHPLNAVGGALILSGVFAFVVLAAIDFTASSENSYRSLITFVAVPALILVGIVIFLIGVRVQIAQARRQGERIRWNLRIEATNPRFRRSLWIFAGLSLSFIAVMAFGGIKGFQATDSDAFCTDTCHTPMAPQAVAHDDSAHAEVECVECHIGPGGASWVQAKLDGIRQLWGVMTGEYDRPIQTPIDNLHGADVLCETCHWSEDFKGEKFVGKVHYRTDEENSPWSVNLLINVGGGPEGEVQEGIHFHMFEANQMEYIATDSKRQDIAWVRVTDEDGSTTVYADPAGAPDPDDPDVEVRRFDCLDCHNRPAHVFEPPGDLMDLEMSRGVIDPELPYIKRVGLDLLTARYETKTQAIESIRSGVVEFYEKNYASRMSSLRPRAEAAAEALVDIYRNNFFPEMNTDYRVRVDNAGHWTNDGCFRCHFSDLETVSGQRISATCVSCHVIVGQGPSDQPSELMSDLGGLEFQHPVDIGGLWAKVPCTQCHSPYSGY